MRGGSRDRIQVASSACQEEDVPVTSVGCRLNLAAFLSLMPIEIWNLHPKTHFRIEMPHIYVVIQPALLVALLLLPPLPTDQKLLYCQSLYCLQFYALMSPHVKLLTGYPLLCLKCLQVTVHLDSCILCVGNFVCCAGNFSATFKSCGSLGASHIGNLSPRFFCFFRITLVVFCWAVSGVGEKSTVISFSRCRWN